MNNSITTWNGFFYGSYSKIVQLLKEYENKKNWVAVIDLQKSSSFPMLNRAYTPPVDAKFLILVFNYIDFIEDKGFEMDKHEKLVEIYTFDKEEIMKALSNTGIDPKGFIPVFKAKDFPMGW